MPDAVPAPSAPAASPALQPSQPVAPAEAPTPGPAHVKPEDKPASTQPSATSMGTTSTPAAVARLSRPEEQQRILVERQFTFMVGILVPELSSANEMVRQVTQRAFRLLAECRGKSVTEILTNAKDRLLSPIFSKPLRALPFGMQIGHIDAVTFCLQLHPPLPDFNEELYRVLTEALALADADDAALVGRGGYRNIVAVTNLRIASIKLLAAALACSEFMNPQQQQMRMKIISVYFKSLYSQSQAVVQVAHTALKQTLQSQSKLPKDVLQAGLRPILMTLAEPSRLTVAGLDGLARLLELLTSYFKVEIGTKLLSHMTQIADPATLERLSAGPLVSPQYPDDHYLKGEKPQAEPIEILAAITRIFHLLPPTAFMYMTKLTTEVVKIESFIRRSGATPFTKPLAQFFDKFPAQAVEYLFGQIEQPGHVKAFRQSLLQPFAQQLRDKVASTREMYLLPLIGEHANPAKSSPTLQIVISLEEAEPGWLVKHDDVLKACVLLFQSAPCADRRRREVMLGPDSGRNENRQFATIFRAYLEHKPDLDVYFALADLYTYRLGFDITPLTRFLYKFGTHLPLDLQRQAIEKFVDLFADPSVPAAFKTQVLRYQINPLLVGALRPDQVKIRTVSEIKEGDATVPQDVAHRATFFNDELLGKVEDIFKGLGEDNCDLWLLTEVYHLAFTLLDAVPQRFSPDLCKTVWVMGWREVTAEDPDPMLRSCAFLLLSKYIAAWAGTPKDTIHKIYVLLLKTSYIEARSVIRTAVNTLAPALPARLDDNERSNSLPSWASWTRQIFVDDARDSQHLLLMLSLLVANSDQFYPSRRLFVPYVVNSITKLGLGPTTPSFEVRLLTVELLDMLVVWQLRHDAAVQRLGLSGPGDKRDAEDEGEGSRKRRKTADGSADVSMAEVTDSKDSSLDLGDDSYSLPQAQRDILASYLVTHLSRSPEPISRGEWTARAFAMLKLLLSLKWRGRYTIKLAVFQRSLMSFDGQDQLVASATNSLMTLREVVAYLSQEDRWTLDHLGQLQLLLDKPIAATARHPQLLELLKPIFSTLSVVLPDRPPNSGDADGETDPNDPAKVKEEPEVKPASNQEDDPVAPFCNYVNRHIADGLKAESTSALCTALAMLGAWHQSKPPIVRNHWATCFKIRLTQLFGSDRRLSGRSVVCSFQGGQGTP